VGNGPGGFASGTWCAAARHAPRSSACSSSCCRESTAAARQRDPAPSIGGTPRAVTAGAEIAVMIVNVDTAKRRIALALAPEGATVGEEMASAVAVGAC